MVDGCRYNFYIRGIGVDNSLIRKYIYRDRILILRINKSKKDSPIARGLNIIIVGCGKVGMTLVERLSREAAEDLDKLGSNEFLESLIQYLAGREK